MTPAQAAAAVNVSRRTIVRAIESQQLQAIRDNRNRWQISQEALAAWSPPTARAVGSAPPPEQSEAATLRVTLAAETARADAAERARDQAEADRDRWQSMAEKLAARPRFRWPWTR